METFSPEQTLNEAELSPEIKGIMEKAQELRTKILEWVMSEKAAKVAEATSLALPGVDVMTLIASAARGETFRGKELEDRSRFNYVMMAGFLTVSYMLLAVGEHKGTAEAKMASYAFPAMEFGPDLVKNTITSAREKIPPIAEFVEKTGNVLLGNPELTTLNLHG